MKSIFTKIIRKQTTGVYLLMIFTVAIFLVLSPGSMSASHLIDVFRQAAPLGIVAIAQTLVLLVAGIDLSVGSLITLVNILAAAIMMGNNANIFPAVVFTLFISALVGFVNGFIIVKLKIPAFLVTLSMSMIIEGFYYLYTHGSPKGSIATGFRFISDGWVGLVPIAGVIWVAVWIVFAFLLYKTTFGRKLYTTGGNLQAARLSGYHVDRVVIITYVCCSLLAGISGLLVSAFIGVASIGVGGDYTLNSIASSVIGGTAFTGGIGGLSGTFAGVVIMTFLQSLLTALNIPQAGKYISQGLIIVIMVAINQKRLRKL
jgi:ribose transport system permease protein